MTDKIDAQIPTTETAALNDEPPQESPGEAAKYRRRLRDTESERDALTGHLNQARDAALTSLLDGGFPVPYQPGETTPQGRTYRPMRLRNPEDIFTLGGLTADDCWNDDGTVNTDRIHQAAASLYAARPELFREEGRPVATIGQHPDHRSLTAGAWQGAFGPQPR